MKRFPCPWRFGFGLVLMALASSCASRGQVLAPVVTITNAGLRVAAANLTSGNFQRYEAPGLRILQGLRPDVVALQEFNYASTNGRGVNTAAAFREMVDAAFGTNFHWFRESGAGYSIPNGIVSRWPILAAGSWDDPQVPDRGFAWARIDLPGTNDLGVVSVHFHRNGGASSRALEAEILRGLILSNFAASTWIVVAGDLNTDSRSEAALATLKTFLSDDAIPTDAVPGGNPNTNNPRSRPYDYVLPGHSLAGRQVATRLGPHTFPAGLVFDSRVFSPLTSVPPVEAADSAAVNMQHMAVVKDFQFSYAVTNWVPVPRPRLRLVNQQVIHWHGLSNQTYGIETSGDMTGWSRKVAVTSPSTNFWYTNETLVAPAQFIRVTFP